MTDNPSPKDIVMTAYKEIYEAHKDNADDLFKAVKGNWNISKALEANLGGSISDIDTLLKIPSLNMIQSSKDLVELNGKLVRFTGFVQDMIDQDFFVGFLIPKMEDFDNALPLKYIHLQDENVSEFDQETIQFCQDKFIMNRGNMICTEIPNENKWLREKRGLEDGKFEEVAELCVMKIYDDMLDQFKMNKSYEFVGTLEYSPLSKEEQKEVADFYEQNGSLPPNAIPDMDRYPKIHVMTYLEHPYKNATKYRKDVTALDSEQTAKIRKTLFSIFTELYGGDELAAEYVLLTLLSKVQRRDEGVPIGVSWINIYSTDCDISREIIKGTERAFKLFTQNTFYSQIDLESLSSIQLIPKKDYNTNRLSRGGLQMLNSTIVLLDETQMKEGKSEGENLILNMGGVASLIEEQVVKYNFQFHEQLFEWSSPVVIVSTGRSVFKNATPIPICTTKKPNVDALNDLDSEVINEIRTYFNQISRKEPMTVSEECTNYIQDLYVKLRKEEEEEINDKKKDVREVGAKTLHSWLTLANLKVASLGLTECETDIINYVYEMEQSRIKRVNDVLKNDN